MSAAFQWLLVAGNIVALIAGFGTFVVWFRRWLVKVVSEPITNLSREVKATRKEADRAHVRIDRLLLGNRNA